MVIHLIFCVTIGTLLHTAKAINLIPVPSSEVIFYASSINATHAVPTEKFEELLSLSGYNADLKNYIVISGFGGKSTGPCIVPFLQSLLSKRDCKKGANVFYLDYQKFSNPVTIGVLNDLSYPLVVAGSFEVAKILAKVLVKLDQALKMLLSSITLIGFSLGCHVAGAVGKAVESLSNQKIYRILACDPNAQLFENPQLYEPLNKDCAKQVDVIHCDLKFGMNITMGTADFWINYWIFASGLPEDKQVQVGCPKRDVLNPYSANSMCSHNMCLQILTQSLTTTLTAGNAPTYWDDLAGATTGSSCLGIDSDPNASGNYYVNTSGCPPYTLDTVCQNPGADLTQYCQDVS